jgi:hypothetical protein
MHWIFAIIGIALFIFFWFKKNLQFMLPMLLFVTIFLFLALPDTESIHLNTLDSIKLHSSVPSENYYAQSYFNSNVYALKFPPNIHTFTEFGNNHAFTSQFSEVNLTSFQNCKVSTIIVYENWLLFTLQHNFGKKQIELWGQDLTTKSFQQFYTNLSFLPLSIALTSTHIFFSGRDQSYISLLPNPLNKTSLISGNATQLNFFHFGTGTINKFTHPVGLFVHENLLYVCEQTRIVVFKNQKLIYSYGPLFKPYHVLVWKKMLVASTNFHLFFYNLKSRQFIGTLTLNSPILSITSSPSFLYVAQSSQVQIYK